MAGLRRARRRAAVAAALARACAEASPVPVGGPLRPWPEHELRPGAVVLDLALCFSSQGVVAAAEAYLRGAGEGRLALQFLALRPAGGAAWLIRSVARVVRVDGDAPARLEFSERLQVDAGDCLAWRHENGNQVSIAFAGVPRLARAPSGLDAAAVSVEAQALEPPVVGSVLDFAQPRHRRYAIQAQFEPSGFLASVLRELGHGLSGPRTVSLEEAKRACWQGWESAGPWGVVAKCCVPLGVGNRACFDERFTYEVCCDPAVAGPLAALRQGGSRVPPRAGYVDSSGAPRAMPELSVDLFVRTFHAKLEELIHLLHSAALFWPPSWGAVVVLDGQSPKDEAACKLLPSWVRCALQDPPPFHDDLGATVFGWIGGSRERHRGLVWKEWTECWADAYSDAEFIAIVDSDVVLVTFGIPQLLFEGGGDHAPKPIIWAHSDEPQFPETVASMGLDWRSEFMDSFPLTIRRKHFPLLRRFIEARFPVPENASTARWRPFDRSFHAFVAAVHERSTAARGTGECPSFHSMMGSYLFAHHRSEYAWSIRHGHLRGVELPDTCPRLRVAQHVAYWGVDKWMAQASYPFKHLKAGGRPPELSEVGYSARANALILAGLCEVPWASRPTPQGPRQGSSGGARIGFVVGANGSWALPDEGLRDVQRDLCTHGARLVEGPTEPRQRLLSHKFPGHLWTDEEAAQCGGLRPRRLWAEYRRLVANFVFAP